MRALKRVKALADERYKLLQEVLDEILVEAFAVVREARRRVSTCATSTSS